MNEDVGCLHSPCHAFACARLLSDHTNSDDPLPTAASLLMRVEERKPIRPSLISYSLNTRDKIGWWLLGTGLSLCLSIRFMSSLRDSELIALS